MTCPKTQSHAAINRLPLVPLHDLHGNRPRYRQTRGLAILSWRHGTTEFLCSHSIWYPGHADRCTTEPRAITPNLQNHAAREFKGQAHREGARKAAGPGRAVEICLLREPHKERGRGTRTESIQAGSWRALAQLRRGTLCRAAA